MKKVALLAAGLIALNGCVIAIDADGETDLVYDDYESHSKARYVKTTSTQGFDATVTSLQDAIEARGFRTFAVIDHAAGARSVDQSLEPTVTIIFGNPKGGTPLIREDRKMGLELPLRAMVWQDGDRAKIATTNITHLADVYDLDNDSLIEKIDRTLYDIRKEAAGK
jgi:uncharacterized protein (DUF302 family)